MGVDISRCNGIGVGSVRRFVCVRVGKLGRYRNSSRSLSHRRSDFPYSYTLGGQIDGIRQFGK